MSMTMMVMFMMIMMDDNDNDDMNAVFSPKISKKTKNVPTNNLKDTAFLIVRDLKGVALGSCASILSTSIISR